MEVVKLGADWSHLIEYLNMTHVDKRINLLHCLSQDMKAIAKMLASAPRVVSKYQANVPYHFLGAGNETMRNGNNYVA